MDTGEGEDDQDGEEGDEDAGKNDARSEGRVRNNGDGQCESGANGKL